VAPHYLAEPFSSVLKPDSESEAFFCHISWRPHQGKKGKKGHATLCGRIVCVLVLCLQRLRRDSRHIIWRESATIWFLSPFGDMTLWNILAFCVVLPYISLYPCMANWMLWGHILSVAPETASMEGGTRFRLNTGHYRPDSLVTGCHRAAP
jgi:hypothetical protein